MLGMHVHKKFHRSISHNTLETSHEFKFVEKTVTIEREFETFLIIISLISIVLSLHHLKACKNYRSHALSKLAKKLEVKPLMKI